MECQLQSVDAEFSEGFQVHHQICSVINNLPVGGSKGSVISHKEQSFALALNRTKTRNEEYYHAKVG